MSETTQIRETADAQDLSRRQREARKDIRVIGDPVLREHAREVTEFDRGLRKLAKRMIRIMHDAPGVGLAAPQVGVLQRLLVYDVDDDPRVLVNPVLDEFSDETEEADEGCLSVPGVTMPVDAPRERARARPRRVRRAGRLPRRGLRGARHPARERPPRRRAHRRPHQQKRARRRPADLRANEAGGIGRPAAASEPHAARLRRHGAVRGARARRPRRSGPHARRARHQPRPAARPPRHAAGAAHQARGRGAPHPRAPARAAVRPRGAGSGCWRRGPTSSSSAPTARSSPSASSTPWRRSSSTRRSCRAGAAPPPWSAR